MNENILKEIWFEINFWICVTVSVTSGVARIQSVGSGNRVKSVIQSAVFPSRHACRQRDKLWHIHPIFVKSSDEV